MAYRFENLPKYTVAKKSTVNGMFWGVFKKGKLVSQGLYPTQAEAQKYAQQLVEDDNWHAANR